MKWPSIFRVKIMYISRYFYQMRKMHSNVDKYHEVINFNLLMENLTKKKQTNFEILISDCLRISWGILIWKKKKYIYMWKDDYNDNNNNGHNWRLLSLILICKTKNFLKIWYFTKVVVNSDWAVLQIPYVAINKTVESKCKVLLLSINYIYTWIVYVQKVLLFFLVIF